MSCGVLESVPERASAVEVEVDERDDVVVELAGTDDERVMNVEGRDAEDK